MMKTKLMNLLLGTAILIAGFTSCDKDDNNTTVVEGRATKMNLTITQKSPLGSKDTNANDNELMFQTVEVFIYNGNSGSLEKHISLNGTTDFTFEDVGNGVYVGNSLLETTTGLKNIYIGVNLPTSLVAQIIENGINTAKSINKVEDIVSAINGFSMFSDVAQITTLTENANDPANKVNVTVKRLVAKTAIQAHSTLSLNVAGGTISSLQFLPRNVNMRFFPLPFNDGGIIKDPNWALLGAGVIKTADFYQPSSTDYTPINPSTITDNKLLTAKYITENTSESSYADECTFVSIRGTFVPSNIMTYKNGIDANGGFESITNPSSAMTFYRLPLVDGTSVYTIDPNIIQDYALANGLDSGGIATYLSGYCYYNLYMNPSNGYNVYRNDFYKTTITKINGLGKPSPDDNGHVLLETPTDLSVTVEILDWQLIDNNTQLPGSK